MEEETRKNMISSWIIEQSEINTDETVCALHKAFGTIKMEDGRVAQVKVILELDTNDWLDDIGT